MMKKHLNNQGMTLIELIVAMVIFSIAALMLSSGLATAMHTMSEGAAIQKTSEQMQMLIDKEAWTEEELAYLTMDELATITYTLEDHTKLKIAGTMVKAEQFYDDTQSLTLAKMRLQEKAISTNERKAEDLYTMVENWDQAWASNVQNKTDADFAEINEIIRQHYNGSVITARNDLWRNYLFYGVFAKRYQKNEGTWVPLDFSHVHENVKELKTGTWHMQIYFSEPLLRDRIIYADDQANVMNNGWHGKRMFYINASPQESQGSWYYNPGKSYQMTDFSLKDGTRKLDWEIEKTKIRNEEDGWIKITYQ